jgi:ElaB/YqjD/DUF883 family membrane-anchored ribosome-binding protein
MATTPNRMTEDLAEGYDDVVRGIARMTRHLGADASSAVSASATAFVHAASDLAEKIKAQSEVLARKAGEEIREHPVATAALAAAAVGLLGFAVTHTRRASGKAQER